MSREISIHALREEGDPRARDTSSSLTISIHALREEGDLVIQPFGQTLEDFYPRPPRGGRLSTPANKGFSKTISIHALREEGDMRSAKRFFASRNFYPRPPRGGRLMAGPP